MRYRSFMTFDPYLSFAEGERGFLEKIFVMADGTPTETRYNGGDGRDYLKSLWRTGRAAYKVIAEREGNQPTKETFDEIAVGIEDIEKDFTPAMRDLIKGGQLVLVEDVDSSPTSDIESSIENAPVGWILDIYMNMARSALASGEMSLDEFPDFEALQLALAVIHIDNYIIAHHLGSDLDAFFEEIQSHVSSASLYKATIEVAKQTASAIGRRSARSRHREGNKQKAAAVADWESEGHKFSSMRAFSRECFKRYGVTDFMTVYNWLREHKKSKV